MKKFSSGTFLFFFVILGLTHGALAKDDIRIGFSMSLTGIYAPAAKGQMEA